MNKKPDWDTYFIDLAKLVSTRSIDPNTKHGCILVDSKNRVISMGYNGPVQGIDDSLVPLERPTKYQWFLHAEKNALLFCSQSSIENGTAYITGMPCTECLVMLIQKGIKLVVYGDLDSACVSPQGKEESIKIANTCGVKLEQHS